MICPHFFPSYVCKTAFFVYLVNRWASRQASLTEKWRDFAHRAYGLHLHEFGVTHFCSPVCRLRLRPRLR